MVLDIVAAAVLIAFGALAIYFSIEGGTADKNLLMIMLVGALAVIAGAWIILTHISLSVLLTKLAGLILAAAGLFLMIGFPDVNPDYQSENMSRTGVFIGLILLIVGLYVLFF